MCLRQVPTFSSSPQHEGGGAQLQRGFPDADLGRQWSCIGLVSSTHGLKAHFQLQGWGREAAGRPPLPRRHPMELQPVEPGRGRLALLDEGDVR